MAASHTGNYLRERSSGERGRPARRFRRLAENPLALRLARLKSRPRAAENPFGEAPALPGIAATRTRAIAIHGAREHNLKNISLAIPRDKMVVITGLSGSGNHHRLRPPFAEGQRRFLDSMSPYARQFVEQLEKPDVDLI